MSALQQDVGEFVEFCDKLYESLERSIVQAKRRPVDKSGDFNREFWNPVRDCLVEILSAERGLILSALIYIEEQYPIESVPLMRELEFCDEFLRRTDKAAQDAKNTVIEEPPYLFNPSPRVRSQVKKVYDEHKKIRQHLTESLSTQEFSIALTSAVEDCIKRLEESLKSLALILEISEDFTIAPRPEERNPLSSERRGSRVANEKQVSTQQGKAGSPHFTDTERVSRSNEEQYIPRVFITFSHGYAAHDDLVLSLSERLRQGGIDTILDLYEKGTPAEGWPRWMLNQFDEADFVLLVCTETYYRRFRGHEVSGKGKGADWEGAIITQNIYDTRSVTTKFVPVLFDAADQAFIPEPVRGRNFYVLTSEDAYLELYDVLLLQAGIAPSPIGEPKRKPRENASPLVFPNAGSEMGHSSATANFSELTNLSLTELTDIIAGIPKFRDEGERGRRTLLEMAGVRLTGDEILDGAPSTAAFRFLKDSKPEDVRLLLEFINHRGFISAEKKKVTESALRAL